MSNKTFTSILGVWGMLPVFGFAISTAIVGVIFIYLSDVTIGWVLLLISLISFIVFVFMTYFILAGKNKITPGDHD